MLIQNDNSFVGVLDDYMCLVQFRFCDTFLYSQLAIQLAALPLSDCFLGKPVSTGKLVRTIKSRINRARALGHQVDYDHLTRKSNDPGLRSRSAK